MKRVCLTIKKGELFKTKNEALEALKSVAPIDYIIVGEEIGDKSEYEHFQVYCRYKENVSFFEVKERVGTAHIEEAKAYDRENYLYCSKSGNFIEEGKRKSNKESKEDIVEEIIEKIKQNEKYSIDNCIIDYPYFVLKHFKDFRDWFNDLSYAIKKVLEHKKHEDDNLPF